MSIIDELEATRRIRKYPNSKDTIIIAVSAQALEDEQQEILDAGCNYKTISI